MKYEVNSEKFENGGDEGDFDLRFFHSGISF